MGIALAAQPMAGLASPIRTPIDTSGETSRSVARMVMMIASYTRWPHPTSPLKICITGESRNGDLWIDAERRAGNGTAIRRVDSGSRFPGDGCDVAYVGELPAGEAMRTFAALRGKAVLSIVESDPLCRGGAMVCLDIRTTSIAFSLNIDAVSRSAVRVDPRVLRLSQPIA